MKLTIFKCNIPNSTILWFYDESTGNRVGYEYYNCNDEPRFYSRAYAIATNGIYGFEYIRLDKIYNI